MDAISLLRKIIETNACSNRKTAKSLRGLSPGATRAFAIFGHALAVERRWFDRIALGEKARNPDEMFPAVSPDEAAALIDGLEKDWRGYFDSLAPDAFSETAPTVAYLNAPDERYETDVIDVFMQIATHSAYHRGQIASAVKREGGAPAATDYMIHVRKKA